MTKSTTASRAEVHTVFSASLEHLYRNGNNKANLILNPTAKRRASNSEPATVEMLTNLQGTPISSLRFMPRASRPTIRASQNRPLHISKPATGAEIRQVPASAAPGSVRNHRRARLPRVRNVSGFFISKTSFRTSAARSSLVPSGWLRADCARCQVPVGASPWDLSDVSVVSLQNPQQ
jgi:hypothetical protein